MARAPVVIKLTDAQRALIRKGSGSTSPSWVSRPWKQGGRAVFRPEEPSVVAEIIPIWNPMRLHGESSSHTSIRSVRAVDCESARRASTAGFFSKSESRRDVIEYVGELVNRVEAYHRTKDVDRTNAFKLDEFWGTDGEIGGGGTEFMNHSCDPNLRRWGGRVLCQSLRPIAAGEELRLD